MEVSRAHSARLDSAEFTNSGWSPDQNAPMKQSKSALTSREATSGSRACKVVTEHSVPKYQLPLGLISSTLW